MRVTRPHLGKLLELNVHAAAPAVFGCSAFVNDLVHGVAAFCPALRCLDLRGACSALHTDAVAAMAVGCPSLRYLDLSAPNTACGDAAMLALGQLTGLTSLQVCGWRALTGSGLLQFATALRPVRHLPAVEPASMPGRMSHGMATRLVMGQRAVSTAALRALNLADCVALDPRSVSEMVGTVLPGLLDLCLFGCLQLNDSALLGMGGHDSRLRRLNAAGVYKITSAGMRYLLSSNPTIRVYNNPNEFHGLYGHRLRSDVEDTWAGVDTAFEPP